MSTALLEKVEAAVRELEAEGDRAGWDWQDGAELFAILIKDDEVRVKRLDVLTSGLRFLIGQCQGNVGHAMLEVARFAEETREEMSIPEGVPAYVEGNGWDLFGQAYRCEAWTLKTPLGEDGGPVYPGIPVSQHPERKESRVVNAVCKDGSMFYLTRTRGEEPVMWSNTNGEAGMSGNVPDGLIRLLNAASGSSLPITVMPGE